MTAGENYQEAITRAVRASAMLLSLISRNANASIEMQKELSLASRYKLTVIPLRLENVEPNDAFAYEFAPPQRTAPRAPPMIQDYRITAASAPGRIRAPENPAELPKALAQGFAPSRTMRDDVIHRDLRQC